MYERGIHSMRRSVVHSAAYIFMTSFMEARFGSIVTWGGIIWGVHVITKTFTTWQAVVLPTGGPLETCAIGILIWLHAKYRKSIQAR